MLILILLMILIILILMMLNVECWRYNYIYTHCNMYLLSFSFMFVTSIIIYYHLFKHYLLIYYCYSYDYHCWYWTFYQQYLGGQLLFHEDHLLRENKRELSKGFPYWKILHHLEKAQVLHCNSWENQDISINAAHSICWISHWEYQ